MKNGIFKLDWASVGDAVVMAIVGAVAVVVYSIVTAPDFNLFTTDWASLGKNVLNVAFASGVVSLAQNFLSTGKGSVLNITPEVGTGSN